MNPVLPRSMHWFAVVLAAAVVWLTPSRAAAQDTRAHEYIVAHGDSLSSIAEHLGVQTHALAERNHLDPPYALRVGRHLRLPDGVDPAVLRTLPLRDGYGPASSAGHAPSSSSTNSSAASAGRRPRHPGTVQLVREFNDEHLTINLRSVGPHARHRMERFLAFPDGRHHPMHPRLIRQIAIISDHFGGRPLHVISGFRPFRHGQWTAHSNHNVGAALDFRIEGVSNRALRDYCRTLPQTGCGFYPRSVFVHMDVRSESATWVDWSRPGQRPMYGRGDRPPSNAVATAHASSSSEAPAATSGSADESVDDVASDDTRVRDAPPPADDDDTNDTSGTDNSTTTAVATPHPAGAAPHSSMPDPPPSATTGTH